MLWKRQKKHLGWSLTSVSSWIISCLFHWIMATPNAVFARIIKSLPRFIFWTEKLSLSEIETSFSQMDWKKAVLKVSVFPKVEERLFNIYKISVSYSLWNLIFQNKVFLSIFRKC